MTSIVFYEKPGCINNSRQKRILLNAGHKLECRNLLIEKWSPDELRDYFNGLPVEQWFNTSAPAIKNGEVDPASVSESKAIELMLDDPLLIRRPLLQVGDDRRVGFDPMSIHEWVGLGADFTGGSEANLQTLEKCQRTDDKSCEVPATQKL